LLPAVDEEDAEGAADDGEGGGDAGACAETVSQATEAKLNVVANMKDPAFIA
jgi:hypothetical protein